MTGDHYDDMDYWGLNVDQRVHHLRRLTGYYIRMAWRHAEEADRFDRYALIAKAVSLVFLGVAVVAVLQWLTW